MSITNKKITAQDISTYGVVAAPDKLRGNPQQNKMIFDRLIRDAVAGLYNSLIDAISADTGAGEVGTEEIEGLTGDNVQTVLESLKILTDSKEGSAEAAAALLLKADKTETAQHIKNVAFNASNGVFTFTKENGQTVTIDTLLEKLAINFAYDSSTQELVLTLADGTVQRISLSSFITETEFADSDQLSFIVHNHTVTATIKPGSITDTMLSSGLVEILQGYISTVAASAAAAAASQTAAAASQTAAAGSATAASGSAAEAAASESAAAGSAEEAEEQADLAEIHKTAAAQSAEEAEESAEEAESSAEDSEAWAVGKRNGTDVPASDETYHNNAKYWAEQAAIAAGGGVQTFNGRDGIVVPQEGDYTAEMVGARPDDWMPDAEDVGAVAATEKGEPGGVATLGDDGLIDDSQMPFNYATTSLALTVAGWSQNEQVVSAPGFLADDTVIVSPAPSSFSAYSMCAVRCTAQANGSLTFACNSAPQEQLTVFVVRFRREGSA